jgi:hypothetical protein
MKKVNPLKSVALALVLVLMAGIYTPGVAQQQQQKQTLVLDGTTWSFTQRGDSSSELPEQTFYLAFTSKTTVILYMGAEKNYVYPIGFGVYEAKTGTITFADTDPLSIITRRAGKTVQYKFGLVNGQVALKFVDAKEAAFNDGQPITLHKEKYSLKPSARLVGTKWRVTTDEIYKGATILFRTATELLIDGRIFPYACIGNNIAIATDSDNALFGYTLPVGNKVSMQFYSGSAFAHISKEIILAAEQIK